MNNFYCPKCLSSEIYISKKGFDVKKGVMGTILSGDLLCGGITGSLKKDELECTCLKYGAQNEAYMCRMAENVVRGLCFNELGVSV